MTIAAGISRAIDRALLGDISPWELCRPAGNFKIYSIDNLSDQARLQGHFVPVKSQNVREWRPSPTSCFELACIPIVAGNHASQSRLSLGTRDMLENTFYRMGIPISVLSCFLDNRIQFTSYPCESVNKNVYVINFRQWCVAWHSDAVEGTSRSILLWMGGSWARSSIAEWVEDFLEDIAQTRINQYTPGILAVLLCARNIAQSLAAMDEEALRTERRLRQITQDGQLKEDDELGNLSATHSWIAARAIRESHRINAASAFLDYVMGKPSSPSVQPDLQTRKDELEALSLLTKSLSAQAYKLRDDATMHISTIYNLIAQRDQATNLAIAAASREIALQSKIDQANSINIAESSRRIAEETKRDSNAMKMIAIVTMVYLPGTFVATCFSMDLFQWSADVPDVINPRIWVYFLFTVFLTAVTVLGFIAWMWWQERQLSRNSEKAENRDGDDRSYTTAASLTKRSKDHAALSPTRTNTSKLGFTSKTADATHLPIRHGTIDEKQSVPNERTTPINGSQNSLQPLSPPSVLPNMPSQSPQPTSPPNRRTIVKASTEPPYKRYQHINRSRSRSRARQRKRSFDRDFRFSRSMIVDDGTRSRSRSRARARPSSRSRSRSESIVSRSRRSLDIQQATAMAVSSLSDAANPQ